MEKQIFAVDEDRRQGGRQVRMMKAIDELGALLGFNPGGILLGEVVDVLEAAVARIKAGGNTQQPPDSLGGLTAEYFLQLGRFVREFDIPRDLPSRVRKAGEELGELAEAVANSDLQDGAPFPTVTEEAADLVFVGLDALILSMYFGSDFKAPLVLRFLIDNLDRKAEKYRQGRNRTEERR